ncbi:MAG TPA: RNA polymerase sigma factor FliA [Kofleriaceae bacterium]|nr:RNA polymerase sigma factor FliA [Kofleriaceae bacterium]
MQGFASNSNRARNQLVEQHAGIARRIALRMARRCPAWIAREDLVSAGMIGLIEAANRYDESRREPFLSFAEHRIRGAILDELRRGDIMPRRVRQVARKISAAMQELEKQGETPTDERIADALGVTLDAYRDGLAQLVNCELAPLDTQAPLVDDAAAPDVQAGHRETMSRVRDALAMMEPRDVTILGLHYVEDLSYQEIAETLRVTPSRVCQLLWRAVERLRAQLAAGEPRRAA